MIEFARDHGKPFAVPEWGLVRSTGGGGDNPFYIQKMYETFVENADDLAYEAYYNAAEDAERPLLPAQSVRNPWAPTSTWYVRTRSLASGAGSGSEPATGAAPLTGGS